MKNKNKNIQETKEKILRESEGKKRFEIVFVEEVCYSKIVEAGSKEEVEEMLNNGEIEDFINKDVSDGTMIWESLEIDEEKK